VSSVESPWWDSVAAGLLAREDLRGRILPIEDLVTMLPDYPDGRRPRARAAARRLRRVLELVERGPNGSLGRGASYRLRPPPERPLRVPDTSDEAIEPATDWLEDAVRRMTRDGE